MFHILAALSLVCRTRGKSGDWIALNLVHQCSHNKALKSRSQDSAASSELHEKAPDPLHGCGKVTEYFSTSVSHSQSKDIHFLLHSFSCSGYSQPLPSDSHPAPRWQGQASRYCLYRQEQEATEDFCCLLQNSCCTFSPYPPLSMSLAGHGRGDAPGSLPGTLARLCREGKGELMSLEAGEGDGARVVNRGPLLSL